MSETRSISADFSSVVLLSLTYGGGTNEDVTAFLGAVKRVAVVQGRQRDDQWIVDYVESCLRGDAMRWFDTLFSGDIQEGWGRVRRLFLQRFISYNAPTSGAPAPAAAAPASARATDVGPNPCLPSGVDVITDYAVDKTLIIGDSGVGKTSLLARYCGYGWQPHTSATDGIHYQVWQTSCADVSAVDHFWDVSGAGQFNPLIRQYMPGTHTIWLVYDLTNQSSFNSIRNWLQLTGVKTADVAVRLIGTKSDCWDKRVVSEQDGRALALSLGGGVRFYETSAKTNEGVQALRIGWMPALRRGAV